MTFFAALRARLRSTRGFTLIELLVVIVIIGILATGAIAVYQSATAKARDSQRISDLEVIVKALQQYNVANGNYPYNGDVVMGTWTAANFKAALLQFTNKWPTDPSADSSNPSGQGGYKYVYCVGPVNSVPGQTYTLAVHLEKKDATYLAGDNTELSTTGALVTTASTASAAAVCTGTGVSSLVVSQ